MPEGIIQTEGKLPETINNRKRSIGTSGLWSIRTQAAQQEVCDRQASKSSSVFAAAP